MENQSQSLSVPSASVQPEIPMPVTPQELKAITCPEVLILANGPEGEPPRPVEDLVNLLKREPLDMNFYPFAHPVGGGYLIQGNILDGTHRFIVRGTAKALGELLEAIEANIRKFHRAHPVFRNDRVRAYLQKRSARAAWLEERAARKEREGTALLKGAREIASFIPFGQPILVGHHSERRHRRDLDRIHSKTSRGFQLQDQAAALRARAVSIEENHAIFSDDPQATEKLEEKIARLEKRQALMVEVNKRIRAGKSLQDLGFSETQEAELKAGDYLKRVGYPNYELTNNGANIRRLKKRLASLKRDEATPVPDDVVIGDIRIVENADENRIQMFFPGKPADAIRDQLKRYGFRWSPSNGCWQRHRSNGATYYAKTIAEAAA